jgi:serine/threonine protein kinase
MQELPGQRIDDYQIEVEIGRGGMARVYRARHVMLDRPAAIKLLLPELAGDQKFVERFLREARAAARLEHPNIVPIYDTGQDLGYHYIAMKFLEGQTLRDAMRGRAMDPGDVVRITSQVAVALDYAHRRGTVHRDIKPGNVMVDPDGRVTLTDFGIARAIEDLSLTVPGAMVGTPAYMSPEQGHGLPATPRSDIYSLGIVVYEMLTGIVPFSSRTPHAVVLAHMTESPTPVHDRISTLTPEIGAVVSKALAKRPEERYATASEFAQALASAAGVSPMVGLLDPLTPLPPSSSTPLPATPTPLSATGQVSQPATIPQPPLSVADEPPTVPPPPPRSGDRPAEQPFWRRPAALVAALIGLAAGFGLVLLLLSVLTGDDNGGGGDEFGGIAIQSDPPGAAYSIDGEPGGTTPATVEQLQPGEHTIQISLDTYVPAEQTISVEAGDIAEVSLALEPLAAAQVLVPVQSIMTKAVTDGPTGQQTPGELAETFQRGEPAIAYLLVESSAHQIRDLQFTFETRWYDPAGDERYASPAQSVVVPRDAQSWTLTAQAQAGQIDPDATGQECRVDLLIDGTVVQSLTFVVERGFGGS